MQDGADWGNSKLYQALKNKIISPDYVLCGHVHHPNKTSSRINKTVIFNPGADFTKKIPKHRILVL
jgi:Icc-related predicted phosphoesterase